MIILDPCYDEYYESFGQFFDLNGNNYNLISDKDYQDPVDILLCNHFYHPGLDSAHIIKKYNYRCAIFLDIKHNREDQIADLDKKAPSSLHQWTITNAIDPDIDNSSIIFNDFVFNRHKAYYQGFRWSPDSFLWYYHSDLDYSLPNNLDSDHKTKIFVAPSSLNNSQGQKYRKKLLTWLYENHIDKGHLGAWGFDSRLFLYPQSVRPNAVSVQDLSDINNYSYRHRGFSPPHNVYYQDTFISIYAETIEHGSSYAATEKTFNPLIKGHFILPFSNPRFINFIQQHYGFRFPDFIDYSYDLICDDDARFEAYIKEADRLINLSLSDWIGHWNAYKTVVEHNQNVFTDRTYHKIDLTRLF